MKLRRQDRAVRAAARKTLGEIERLDGLGADDASEDLARIVAEVNEKAKRG
ncbi:MAG: hypothetical protein Q8O67_20975 [Deltaproteobacteria bacterium]|nr:hypothetical protein [Deltaproteobacteria bacterium]